MENRFGVKDFIILLALGTVIVLVVLAMYQYDRQWDELQAIRAKLDGQARDLQQLQMSLERGVAMVPVGTNAGAATRPTAELDKNDPFARIRAAQSMPNYARGDWLVDAFSGQVANLTPLLSGDNNASRVQGNVVDTLATLNPVTLDWQPLLAKEWKVTDNTAEWQSYVDRQKAAGVPMEQILKDPDLPPAVRINFKLRDDVRFSDGEPLTADDVVFTYNLIMNPAIAAPRHKAYLERIRKVEKKGPYEVEFVYAEPYFEAFELAASFEVLPEHFYGKFAPEQFNQSVGLLMGSGPYRMENPETWRPGTPIQLVRNERYWGVPPAFDRLVYKEITGDKGRLFSFRNGEVDLFSATPEQYRELVDDPLIKERSINFEYQNPIGGYRYVAWNQQNPLFEDRRVRQALTMLLDRQRMIEEIMLGYAVQATGPFNPVSKQYNPDVQPWPYDVSKARALLTEAGFTDRNNDGLLESPGGKPFEFRLTYPAGSGNYDKMVQYMKDAYARAGIRLVPDPLEWAVFTDRLKNKNFEAISLGWTSGIESDIYQMFHSSQAKAEGDNFMSYVNPRLDAAIMEARQTMDESKRMPLWQRAHQIIHEDQPYTFLWFGKSLGFIDNRINNVQVLKLGLSPSAEWFVPIDRQRYTQ